MVLQFCQVKRNDGAPCTLGVSHKGRHCFCGFEEGFPEPIVTRSMKTTRIVPIAAKAPVLLVMLMFVLAFGLYCAFFAFTLWAGQ